MNFGELFQRQSEVLIAAAVFSSLLLSGEVGFWLGRFSHAHRGGGAKSQLDIMQAAMLGSVALLIGFSFSMAVSRYDLRKQEVVEEANAIGTTYLRAELLPHALGPGAARLLRDYVEVRLEHARSGLSDARLAEMEASVADLHARLWSLAVKAGASDARSVPIGLFVQSVNATIDSYGSREAALRNHVPMAVLVLLWVVIFFGTGFMGYSSGVDGQRALAALLTFSVVTGLVFMLIVDLDRPRRGFVRVSQRPMLDLQRSMQEPPPR